MDSRTTGGGGRLLFVRPDGAGGDPIDGGGGLGTVEVGTGALGAMVAGRGAGVGTRGTATAGNIPDPGFLVTSKSGFMPAGVCGIAGFGRAAAASASACLSAASVMPLGNVSVNLRRAASSSVSSGGAFGRGAANGEGLPKAPVGNLGAGGIVGDRRGMGRGAVGTTSDGGV
jgi:hypothetical protein